MEVGGSDVWRSDVFAPNLAFLVETGGLCWLRAGGEFRPFFHWFLSAPPTSLHDLQFVPCFVASVCSALYKLFSTSLYGRLYPVLDEKQAEDQAGFRKSYQTSDHLATYRLIEQKCIEWGIKMWTATVDFTKAFDSISHKSIWDALKSCNIDHDYISLLKKIY